ncbi:GcrA family cell cycle regulator [Chelativorans sp. M5D2P16]|uniref:GcrA family cell cycle regulator n=1 Tax=Chelativorans sp. M5D2P16 TaxID=3095678 RepID=UPI002ACAB1BB|nr:GcrA family cell cycle regulator [Chelativorans sp. M5D2P16]MDZ5697146.1 GcrA family cell cycle regulator [Chelativorans sp. M5D2P16]
MNWTDERVELLKKLWAEGLSASQIAAQLGGVSRNAVIGKVHRLKLSSRGRATSTAPRQKTSGSSGGGTRRQQRSTRPVATSVGATALKVRFEEDAVAYQDLRPVEDVVVPISRNLQLVELTERTCKWPNGDPLETDFSFCGNDTGETGPYCTFHSRLAYQPAGERRRTRQGRG